MKNTLLLAALALVPDGLEVAIGAMKREGISDADIDTMMRKNPAKLLGLN